MLSKSTVNELEMFFPNKILKLYTIETDTTIDNILENFTVAYLKQVVSPRLTLLILVFIDDKQENKFQIELLKNSISYVQKDLTYRAKALFNRYINESLEHRNIITE